MQYLGSQKKTPLWPDDAKCRADIMRWQSWHLQHWSRGTTTFVFENLVKGILKHRPARREGAGAGGRAVPRRRRRARQAPGHPSLPGGDTLTLADFTVVAPLFLAEAGKIPLEKYSNVRRWFGAQAALPAWQQTAPKR